MMNAPKCNWRELLPSLGYNLGKSRFAYVWKSASSGFSLRTPMPISHMGCGWRWNDFITLIQLSDRRNGWLLVPSKVDSNWLHIKQSVQPANSWANTSVVTFNANLVPQHSWPDTMYAGLSCGSVTLIYQKLRHNNKRLTFFLNKKQTVLPNVLSLGKSTSLWYLRF